MVSHHYVSLQYNTWNITFSGSITGGYPMRVAAVTLDNMAEHVFAQQEDLP